MTMIAGTVTVADDESAAGTGMALALYTALAAAHAADLPPATLQPPYDTLPAAQQPAAVASLKAARVAQLRGYAKDAAAMAAGIVPYIQAHATVDISAVTASLAGAAALIPAHLSPGTMPASTAPGTALIGYPTDYTHALQGVAGGSTLPVTGAAGATTLGVG